jgi:predicted metal-dependent enzyme (double-stranded beta helix superfamily)
MHRSSLTTPAAPAAPDPWRVAGSRALHPSGCDGSASLVAVIAEGLAAVAAPWELGAGESPDQRQHQLLLATEAYDAWLIHWPPGTGLGAHDHGGSAGAFAVVSGSLEERTIAGRGTRVRRVTAGRSVSFDAGHVHAVANPSDVAATSVHVYSPPLRAMGFYREADGELVRDRVDELTGKRRR